MRSVTFRALPSTQARVKRPVKDGPYLFSPLGVSPNVPENPDRHPWKHEAAAQVSLAAHLAIGPPPTSQSSLLVALVLIASESS